jgi:glycogen synthase
VRLLLVDREFPPNPHGGIGSYNLTLARCLGKTGHFVVVLSCTTAGKPVVTEEPYGLLVRIPHRPPSSPLSSYLRWIDPVVLGLKLAPHAIRLTERLDLSLVEIPSAGGYGYFLAQRIRERIPVVTRFHGTQGKLPIDEKARSALGRELAGAGYGRTRRLAASALNAPLWQLERRQMTASHHVTCPSHFARAWLGRQIGPPERRLPVIHNGLHLEGRADTPPPARAKTLAFVGRCSVPKGVTVLARAVPRILGADPETVVVFAGPLLDPHATRILSALAERYPGRVRIPGRLPHEQAQRLLAGSYALLAPSFYEICPMAVLEAMAWGTPTVASAAGPFPELVDHGTSGLLFPAGDAGALTESVVTLLASPRLRRSMAEACRSRFAALYDMQVVVQQLEAFYAEVCARGESGPGSGHCLPPLRGPALGKEV